MSFKLSIASFITLLSFFTGLTCAHGDYPEPQVICRHGPCGKVGKPGYQGPRGFMGSSGLPGLPGQNGTYAATGTSTNRYDVDGFTLASSGQVIPLGSVQSNANFVLPIAAPGTITASESGLYYITYTVTVFTPAENDPVSVALFKNGVEVPFSKYWTSNSAAYLTGQVLVSFEAGDSFYLSNFAPFSSYPADAPGSTFPAIKATLLAIKVSNSTVAQSAYFE